MKCFTSSVCECVCSTKTVCGMAEISNQCTPFPCYKEGSERCVDGQASFTCVCKPGWKGARCEDGESWHVNWDFILFSGAKTSCFNISYLKSDRKLLNLAVFLWCVYLLDIDECSDHEFPAGCNQRCINFPGSFRCMCEEGYFINDKINCVGKTSFILVAAEVL